MKRWVLGGLFAAGILAIAGAANALAIVEYDGGSGHLTDPTNHMGFEGIQQATFPDNTSYLEDGISITYVSASGRGIVSTGEPDTGDYGWAPAGLGDYTDIRMTNGSQMDEVQWRAEGCCGTVIYWELLLNGQPIEPMQHFGAVGAPTATSDSKRSGPPLMKSDLSPSVRLSILTPSRPTSLPPL